MSWGTRRAALTALLLADGAPDRTASFTDLDRFLGLPVPRMFMISSHGPTSPPERREELGLGGRTAA
ncbi:hypothetical protein ABZ464_19650 [Streptomyces sp. NPDC005820]|uniref:hypothetical protein n=1 Tax=Streptomyces sp. NPDC005820 TaxID=3157069 RepID=UPI0033DFE183